MSDELLFGGLLATLANTGILSMMYRKLLTLERLRILHCQRHPEDVQLLEESP